MILFTTFPNFLDNAELRRLWLTKRCSKKSGATVPLTNLLIKSAAVFGTAVETPSEVERRRGTGLIRDCLILPDYLNGSWTQLSTGPMPATPWTPPPPHRPYHGEEVGGGAIPGEERGVGSRAQIGLCLPISSACAKMRRGLKQCWKWRRRPLRAVEIISWKRLTVYTSCQRFVFANVEILFLCFHRPTSILSTVFSSFIPPSFFVLFFFTPF